MRSVDERLRIGLGRNAGSFEPQVELLLDAAWARHRRAQRVRWAAAATGLAVAACTVLVLALTLGSWVPGPGSPVVPATPPPAVEDLQGRYTGEVAEVPSAPGVEGEWVLDFRPEGVLSVQAPPSYPGVVSGVLYSLDQGLVRTDLFSQDLCSGRPVGRYTAALAGQRLSLTVVEDPCPQRAAVLGGTAWAAVP